MELLLIRIHYPEDEVRSIMSAIKALPFERSLSGGILIWVEERSRVVEALIASRGKSESGSRYLRAHVCTCALRANT
jgi:hypothetical protein